LANVMMKCGCVATGTCKGNPVCVTHIGLVPEAEEVAETPDLTGRTARCAMALMPISPPIISLPFFVHRPKEQFDEYYCGCYGWN